MLMKFYGFKRLVSIETQRGQTFYFPRTILKTAIGMNVSNRDLQGFLKKLQLLSLLSKRI